MKVYTFSSFAEHTLPAIQHIQTIRQNQNNLVPFQRIGKQKSHTELQIIFQWQFTRETKFRNSISIYYIKWFPWYGNPIDIHRNIRIGNVSICFSFLSAHLRFPVFNTEDEFEAFRFQSFVHLFMHGCVTLLVAKCIHTHECEPATCDVWWRCICMHALAAHCSLQYDAMQCDAMQCNGMSERNSFLFHIEICDSSIASVCCIAFVIFLIVSVFFLPPRLMMMCAMLLR